MGITLKIELTNSYALNEEEIIAIANSYDDLYPILADHAVINPINKLYVDITPSYTREAEEIHTKNKHEPYNELGTPIKDLNESDKKIYNDKDEYYWRPNHIKWYGDSDFETFAADWMTRHPESLKDLCMHGCQSGVVSELIYTSDIKGYLHEYYLDIQEIVCEIYEDIGEPSFMSKDFSFDQLVWMCFEETVRKALYALELDDI